MEKYEIELPKVWLHLNKIEVKYTSSPEEDIKVCIEITSDNLEKASQFAVAFEAFMDEVAERDGWG